MACLVEVGRFAWEGLRVIGVNFKLVQRHVFTEGLSHKSQVHNALPLCLLRSLFVSMT